MALSDNPDKATMNKPCTAPAAAITVVVPTHNRAEYLGESLASLLSQSLPLRRIVVVDDGSTDETRSVVERFGARVEYVHLTNGGKARALNQLLPTVDTEFVWFFDDDDVAHPDAAEQLAIAALRLPAATFVFGDHELVWARGCIDQATRVVPRPYAYVDEPLGMQRLRLFRECTVMMTGSLLRTAAVRAVGGLNEALLRCQDYDLMLRLAVHGPFGHVPCSVYRWRQHDGHRGTGAAAHGNDDRVAAWAKYNEPIGLFLRDKTPTSSFDPQLASAHAKPASGRVSALARAWAIAPKLPLKHGVELLAAAIALDPASPLTPFEREMTREAFNHAFVALRPSGALWALAGLVRSAAGRAALREVGRGLYWLSAVQSSFLDRLRWRSLAFGLAALSWARA